MRKILLVSAVFALAACSHKTTNHDEHHHTESAVHTPTGPSEAEAVLKAAKGKKVKGTIKFKEENGQILVTTEVEGLKAGPHGFHIHEVGNCDAPDFSTAGGHFNPSQSVHGSEHSEHRHGGDMGNLIATAKGKAHTTLTITGVTLKDGPASIIGKAVIIHEGKDDLKSQPAGNSGPREACGIIKALE